jgi:hypothetical protein
MSILTICGGKDEEQESEIEVGVVEVARNESRTPLWKLARAADRNASQIWN